MEGVLRDDGLLRLPKRGEEPEGLTALRDTILGKVNDGLNSFDPTAWQRAMNMTTQAQTQQSSLMGQLPNYLQTTSGLAGEMANMARTGNIPSVLADNLNASISKGLQSSMGNLLTSLGKRGVVNSSITNAGTNQLAQTAADAFARNYLTAYQSALSGMGSALSGAQSNTGAALQAINTLGTVPTQAYEGAGAGITPAFNLWKAWQGSYDGRTDYDTIATQNSSSCITGDTLITLSDGREIPVAELNTDDEIKAWDFDTGKLTSAPLTAFFRSTKPEGIDVVRVEFEDGSNVGVILEHLFFDLTEGKFVAVNADNKEDYVGHSFAKVVDEHVIPVKVSRIYIDGKAEKTYAPQCRGYLNFLAGGFITGNEGQLGLCNMFDFDTGTMTIDREKKAKDLEQFGTLDYEELEGLVSRSFFENNHCEEFSVAFDKGLITLEQFKDYLSRLSPCFLE